MCKILIVDDETSIRDVITSYADSIGFKYVTATNAVEALLCIEKVNTIRVCLIDLHLPGMDGLTLCRKIKRIDPMMICVAMTGFKTLFSLVECRQSGFDDMIFKPFDFELLKKILMDCDLKLNRWKQIDV